MPGYVIFLLVMAAIIGLIILFNWLAVRKRRDEMARLSHRLGYKYLPTGGEKIPERLRATTLFSKPRDRKVWNLVFGRRNGLEVSLFDYSQSASTGPGNSNETRAPGRSVVLVEVPGASFPPFLLRLEGVIDRIKAAAGFEDIDFESDEFSKRYYVTCAEKRFAYDVITAKQMKLLLSVEDMNVEMCGRSIVFYLGSILAARELEWLHGFAMEFVANIPPFVLEGTRGPERCAP
ncbi:MAG: hypothetical protein ACYS9X_04745 [Planctomycetota bacterium]|jgi:hypothetical protein